MCFIEAIENCAHWHACGTIIRPDAKWQHARQEDKHHRLGHSRGYKVHSFYRGASDKWKANNGVRAAYRRRRRVNRLRSTERKKRSSDFPGNLAPLAGSRARETPGSRVIIARQRVCTRHVIRELAYEERGKEERKIGHRDTARFQLDGATARRSEFRERSSANDECRWASSNIRFAADKCNPTDSN